MVSLKTFFRFLQIWGSTRLVLGQRRRKHFLLKFPILVWLSTEVNLMQPELFFHSSLRIAISVCFVCPTKGKAEAPQLTLPWHQDLHGISCKECPNPRESSVSEKSEHQMAGRWAGAFLLTAELPSSRVPPLLPQQLHPFPFQNGASGWRRVLSTCRAERRRAEMRFKPRNPPDNRT